MYEVEKIFREVETAKRITKLDVEQNVLGAYHWGARNVSNRLGWFSVNPIGLDEAIGLLHSGTSAGYGYSGTKGDNMEAIYAQARALEVEIKCGGAVTVLPALLNTRGHLHKWSSEKRRLTYVYPAAVVAIEQMFLHPLMEKVKEVDGLLMSGKKVIGRTQTMLSRSGGGKKCTFKGDFSNFDRHVITPLIEKAFDILEEHLDFANYEGSPVGLAKQKRYRRLWEFVREYFTNTPVMTPSGRVTFLRGTVVSGSSFTQLVDSIISALYVETVAFVTGITLINVRSLGDDVYLELVAYPDVDEWASLLLEWFGCVLSVVKSRVMSAHTPKKGWIGYEFRGGLLFRPDFEWFNLALHPERKVSSVEQSFTRLIAYMFLGGVNSLKFSQFFEHYQSGFEIKDGDFILSKEFKGKVDYGGLDLPKGRMFGFTKTDFTFSLLKTY